MSIPIECFRCGSRRTVKGRVIGHKGYKPRFLPDNTKFLKLSLSSPFLKVEYESFVCADCGLFWSITDAPTAKNKIRKWGKDELKGKLGL